MSPHKSGIEGSRQDPPSTEPEFERVVDRLLSKPHTKSDDFLVAKEPLTHSAESMASIQKLRTRVIESVSSLPIDDAIAQAEHAFRSQREVHWKYIFTTGEPDAPNREKDSIYFVTDDQFSIRLKRADRDAGDITKVIRPVMEIVVFEDEKRKVSFEPERGRHVYEYMSKEFHEMQEGIKPFRQYVSTKELGLTRYGNVLVIGKNPGDLRHPGHQVNKIYAISVMMGAPSRLK